MADVVATEFTELDPDELHLVKRGANGFPTLLAKAVAEEIDAAKSDSAEADAIEDELTGDDGEVEKKAKIKQVTTWPVPKAKKAEDDEDLEKKKLSAADRKKIPKGDFAVPGKAPASGSFPIPDRSHAANALARASGKPVEAKVKAAVRRKFPDMGAKKSPGVPDFSVATPREAGHTRETGQSGQRIAPMTAGTKPLTDPSHFEGGESVYRIPNEGAMMAKTQIQAITGLFSAFEREQARKDAGGFMAQDNIGSPAWEEFDSVTLASIAAQLASCGKGIDAIMRREAIEAAAGDAGDVQDTWDLQQAGEALDAALGIVARLSFHEGAEKASDDDITSIRNRLTDVLGGDITQNAGDTGSVHKETIMVQTTPEELAKSIADAVDSTLAAREKAAKKASKKAAKAEAKKNANNKGDITAQELQGGVNGRSDADDVGVVGGGVRKDKRDALKKQVKELSERLEKVAAQPRTGGPILDGQARGAAASVNGQSETVVKGVDGHDYTIPTQSEIDKLEKQLEEELGKKGPEAANRASGLSWDLTRKKLLRSHVMGEA